MIATLQVFLNVTATEVFSRQSAVGSNDYGKQQTINDKQRSVRRPLWLSLPLLPTSFCWCIMTFQHRAWIGLGSNVGDRAGFLRAGLRALAAHPCVELLGCSSFSETAPVGGPPQADFLNAAAALATDLLPRALLVLLQDVESRLERTRSVRWGPRTLDLDLLLYGGVCLDEPGLTLPHPHLHERAFVLEPLCELAADLEHPVIGGRLDEHLARCRDPLNVRPYAGDGWQTG